MDNFDLLLQIEQEKFVENQEAETETLESLTEIEPEPTITKISTNAGFANIPIRQTPFNLSFLLEFDDEF